MCILYCHLCLTGAPIDVWFPPSPPHSSMCIYCHFCLIGAPIDVWFPPSYPHPIRCAISLCLTKGHALSATITPIFSFLKIQWLLSLAAKRGHGVLFPGCNSWMTPSCAMTYQLHQLFHLCSFSSTCQGCDSHHSLFARLFHVDSVLAMLANGCRSAEYLFLRKPNIWPMKLSQICLCCFSVSSCLLRLINY